MDGSGLHSRVPHLEGRSYSNIRRDIDLASRGSAYEKSDGPPKRAPQNQTSRLTEKRALPYSSVTEGVSALARGFQTPKQQRQQRIDPRRSARVVPFLGMA